MRTFTRVERVLVEYDDRIRYDYFGIMPGPAPGPDIERPLTIYDIGFKRFRAERMAWLRGEPLEDYIDDERYFAVVASERARRLALRLLEEM